MFNRKRFKAKLSWKGWVVWDNVAHGPTQYHDLDQRTAKDMAKELNKFEQRVGFDA